MVYIHMELQMIAFYVNLPIFSLSLTFQPRRVTHPPCRPLIQSFQSAPKKKNPSVRDQSASLLSWELHLMSAEGDEEEREES